MTEREFESLLYRRESESLDFKREMYRVQGGTDRDKGELIKDVLAFANAWREGPAYIVAGVGENGDGSPEVVGLAPDAQIDDATLQQIVNSKLNRPIRMIYERLAYRGKLVGVITIAHPLDRPFYLVRPFGGLPERTVFIRRGSSTAIADPDEIGRIGAADTRRARLPKLAMEFADIGSRNRYGPNASITIGRVTKPRPGTPEHDVVARRLQAERSDIFAQFAFSKKGTVEAEFERIRSEQRTRRIGFWIENTGSSPARDVRATFRVLRTSGIEVLNAPAAPPQKAVVPNLLQSTGVQVEVYRDGWDVVVFARKLQAGEGVFIAQQLVVAGDMACHVGFNVQLHADELTEPQPLTMLLQVKCEPRVFTLRT